MSLTQIRIVLVEPSHPGNIGAVARAMKTMALTNLVLVTPKKFPHDEATKRAVGADSVLQQATVVSDVKQAIAGCQWVLGTSVRDREVTWPTVDPKQMAEQIGQRIFNCLDTESIQTVAILFGRENSGLSNQELDLCHAQIRIPANDEYSSLNLGSAVQIIAYEIYQQYLLSLQANASSSIVTASESIKKDRHRLATMDEQTGYFEHLQQTLLQLDFVKSKPPIKLMRKLTRLYNKAQLTVEEVQILRGILAAMQMKLETDRNAVIEKQNDV